MDEQAQGWREARELLRRAGVAADDLVAGAGVANEVWLTPDHVIRLGSGRFRDAFAFEMDVLRRLPAEIPHPRVVANGERDDTGEYLVLERLPGVTLDAAWSDLATDRRQRLVAELAAIAQRIHTIAPAPWMDNPWVGDAMAGRYADAYHAPPPLFRELIDSTRRVRPDALHVLGRVDGFIARRLEAFAGDVNVPVHADLHFRNVLVDGDRISGLIDFEGFRLAPADTELDMFLRELRRELGDAEAVRDDSGRICGWFQDVYPALFAHPRLIGRLEVYEALWHLVQLHWSPAGGASDPVRWLERVLRGGFRNQTSRLLDL